MLTVVSSLPLRKRTLQSGPHSCNPLVQRIQGPPMSMRIHNDSIATTAASQPAPAGSAAPTDSSIRGKSTASFGADQVDISSLSASLAASNAALASQRAGRVSQLAALYARGQYHVDSMQLSRALISKAVGAGLVETDS